MTLSFPETGFVRLKSILGPVGPIPVSRSTWWASVRSGRFPPPVKIGGVTAWRVASIHALIDQLNATAAVAPRRPGDRVTFDAAKTGRQS